MPAVVAHVNYTHNCQSIFHDIWFITQRCFPIFWFWCFIFPSSKFDLTDRGKYEMGPENLNENTAMCMYNVYVYQIL